MNVKEQYTKHMMRGLVVEQLAHTMVHAVSQKPPPTLPTEIIFGKEEGAMSLIGESVLLNTVTGPVWRFLSMFDDTESRVGVTCAALSNPLPFLVTMAWYSPDALDAIVKHFHGEQEKSIRLCLASAAFTYICMDHQELTRLAQNIVDELGEQESGKVTVDTAKIYEKFNDNYWLIAADAAEIAENPKDSFLKMKLAANLAEADQADYDWWVIAVEQLPPNLMDALLSSPTSLN